MAGYAMYKGTRMQASIRKGKRQPVEARAQEVTFVDITSTLTKSPKIGIPKLLSLLQPFLSRAPNI